MVLSISTTHVPATDLGYLLAKNPGRCHTRETTFGSVSLFFSAATETFTEATILAEIDPVKLVRGEGASADQYTNQAPYALTSFMSVGMREICSTAMGGRSKERQELAETAIPLVIKLPTLPVHGKSRIRGEALVRALFEPMGWQVEIEPIPLDANFPEWGNSRYLSVTLTGTLKLQDALRQVYVLLPVLDDDKHYWIGRDEIDKLVRSAGDWLTNHPAKAMITRRYLRKADFVRDALDRLIAEETPEVTSESSPEETAEVPELTAETDPEAKPAEEVAAQSEGLRLHDLRLQAVADRLATLGAKTVLDLGCGEGKLLRILARSPQFTRIVGLEVSYEMLRRLEQKFERSPAHVSRKIELLHGSLTYGDRRLIGFDAAALVEVIEHLEPTRLDALERSVFGLARPGHVVVTTPNREYNQVYELSGFRHDDHRFEWTREEFTTWCNAAAEKYGYSVTTEPLGPVDEKLGAPSQMGVFTRAN